jgi:hypothetical protein
LITFVVGPSSCKEPMDEVQATLALFLWNTYFVFR